MTLKNIASMLRNTQVEAKMCVSYIKKKRVYKVLFSAGAKLVNGRSLPFFYINKI